MKMEIRSDRNIPKSVKVAPSASGYVEGPASEIDVDAIYTFEAEIEGRWYRWTGQKPNIVGDRCRFSLRDGAPIVAPS
jgi:hypothetical protein